MQSGSQKLISDLSPLTKELQFRLSLTPLAIIKIYQTILQLSQQEAIKINSLEETLFEKLYAEPEELFDAFPPRKASSPLKDIPQPEWTIYYKIYCAIGIMENIDSAEFDKKTQQEYFYAALYLLLNEDYSDILGHIDFREAQYLFGLDKETSKLREWELNLLRNLFELPRGKCKALTYLTCSGDPEKDAEYTKISNTIEEKSLDILKELTFGKLKIFSTYTQLACKEIEVKTESYLKKLSDEIATFIKKNEALAAKFNNYDDESKTDPDYSQEDVIYQFALNNSTEITDGLKPLWNKFNRVYLVKNAMKKHQNPKTLADAKTCIEGHFSEFKTHRGNVGFAMNYLGLDEYLNVLKPTGRVWAEFFFEKEKQIQEFLSASSPDNIDIFKIDNSYTEAKQEEAKMIENQKTRRYRARM